MRKPFLVAIAGPSGSGKSEVCEMLQKEFRDVLCVSTDDYFLATNKLPIIGKWENADVPQAIQFDLLAKYIKDLKNGRSITVSVLKYPHKSLERTQKVLHPKSLVIIEGFLVLYDKNVRDACDVKFFIDIPEELQSKRRMHRD